MTAPAGPGEELGRSDRPALLKKFRQFLVKEYQSTASMNRILRDTGLEPTDYVTNVPEPDDCWSEALARIAKDSSLLIKFIETVKNEFQVEQNAIKELYDFEMRRKSAEQTPAERLHDSMGFTAVYARQLQQAVHLNLQDLAALKDRIHNLFRLLDELRREQSGAAGSAAEIVLFNNIERRANICIDTLQYYAKIVELAEPVDAVQIGAAYSPGDLGGHARDEMVLLQGKAELRNALARLAESA